MSGGHLCVLMQKHRPNRQVRRWQHLCADGRIGKMAWTSNPSHFRVFRFLFGRGTDVHLPSQENEIQPISQQPTSVSKFIICLFRHAEGLLEKQPFLLFLFSKCDCPCGICNCDKAHTDVAENRKPHRYFPCQNNIKHKYYRLNKY